MKNTKPHMRRSYCIAWLLGLALCIGLTAPALGQSGVKPHSSDAGTSVPAGPSALDNLPRLGVEVLHTGSEEVLRAIGSSGVGFARVQLHWSNIEPTNTDPSNYAWARYDTLFRNMAADNLAPLVTVMGCPTWACLRDNGPLYDDKYGDFAEFIAALASRYSQARYGVHYWEFWNEPDAAGGSLPQNGCPANNLAWGCHPDKYVRMLSIAYPAIKAADAQSVVMNGGLAYDNWFNQGGPFNPNFLPDILSMGAARYLDAVAFHYYRNNAHGWTNIGVKTEAIRLAMSTRGVDLPIICTETGLTSSPAFGSSEQIQARYVVQMTAHGASKGLRAQVWYLDRDYLAPFPGQEIFLDSGLMRLNNTLKPSYYAMQVLAQEVGSGAFVRQLGANDGVAGSLEGYRFRTAISREVSVVWNNSPGQAVLTVDASQVAAFRRAVGLYGDPVSAQPGPDGNLLVSVGPDPLYLEWTVSPFSDVPIDSFAFPYIEYLANLGVISGYADGTFRPGNSATRGQFSKMIVLGMGWPINVTGGPHFRDVPPDYPFYGFIETAYSRGIIGGYQCGGPGEPCPGSYFRPGNNITRAQIAKIIVGAKGWSLPDPTTPTFSDVPRSSTFYSHIEAAFSHGIISGYNDGTFRPGNNATRAQLSKMLALALQQP